MRSFVYTLLFISLAFGAIPVSGEKLPSGGTEVAFDQAFPEWRITGRAAKSVLKEGRSASGMSFNKSVELELTQKTERPYDIQFNSRVTGQIKKDDVLLCSFYARCRESSDESALGKFTVFSSVKARNRYFNPFTKTYTIGREWKHFTVPFIAPVSNDVGYMIGFRLGGVKPQTLELGGFEVVNYADKRVVGELPHTETRYEGMAPDAPWRKAANERIREHRMENLVIKVVDRNGNPVPGAKVKMELKNHAFGFGAALSVGAMFNPKDPEQSKRYQEAVEDLFNKAVCENRTKWKHFSMGDPQLEEAIAWCAERKIPMRGHCLIWPSWKWTPREYLKYREASDPAPFKAIIEERIRTAASAYPDTFVEWDVVNEPVVERDFMDLYGDDMVADWFRIAKAANPDFVCYLNDYAILAGFNEQKQQAYYDWIAKLLEQGAPLEGIGFQGHFRAPVPPEDIIRRLDRFAEFGLPMQITEYDFEDTDELLQARYTRDFMTAVFSHPKTVGIITWCVWESAAWKPSAAFYDKDWKKKRIALAWEHMIEKEWHTRRISRTNADGQTGVRGFLGDYEIKVSFNGKTKVVKHELLKGAGKVVVKF